MNRILSLILLLIALIFFIQVVFTSCESGDLEPTVTTFDKDTFVTSVNGSSNVSGQENTIAPQAVTTVLNKEVFYYYFSFILKIVFIIIYLV